MTKVVNRLREEFDIYIGRGSPYGNPFTHLKVGTLATWRVGSRQEAVDGYREWIQTQPHLMAMLVLCRDKTLGCYCVPKRCHGHVIVEFLEKYSDETLRNWQIPETCGKVDNRLFD